MRSRLISILTLPLLLLSFQNCGRAGAMSAGPVNNSEQAIGATSSYDKIVYDSFMTAPLDQKPRQSWARHVEVDLRTGSVELSAGDLSGAVRCALDAIRLNALKNILASAEVCKPGPLPPNTVVCMIYTPPDIELSDTSGQMGRVELSPQVCNSGTFLCNGQDTDFRAILADLRDHPPAGCNLN